MLEAVAKSTSVATEADLALELTWIWGLILGTSIGDICADEVLCRFLLLRDPDLDSACLCGVTPRGDRSSGLIIVVLGVEPAVNFGVFASIVGVLWSSSMALLVSTAKTGRVLVTESGNIISSMYSSLSGAGAGAGAL